MFDYADAWKKAGAKYHLSGFSEDYEEISYRDRAPFISNLKDVKRRVENAQASIDLKDYYNTHRNLMVVQNLHEGLISRNRHRVFSQDPEEKRCPVHPDYPPGKVNCEVCNSVHVAPICTSNHELHGPIDLKDLPIGEDYYLLNIGAVYIGTSECKFLPEEHSDILNLSIPEDIAYDSEIDPTKFLLSKVQERLEHLASAGSRHRDIPVLIELDIEAHPIMMDLKQIHRLIGDLIELRDHFKRELVVIIGMSGVEIQAVPEFPYGPQEQKDNLAYATFDMGSISGLPIWPAYIFGTKTGTNRLQNGKYWYKLDKRWTRFEHVYGRTGNKTKEFYHRFSLDLYKVMYYLRKAMLRHWNWDH
jgi:hypothetical protein